MLQKKLKIKTIICSLALLVLIAGCGNNDSNRADYDTDAQTSLVPGIDVDTFLGVNEDNTGDAASEEKSIIDSLALVMSEKYSAFESKLIWIHYTEEINENNSEANSDKITIKASLLNAGNQESSSADIVRENVLENVYVNELIQPRVIIDLTDIDNPGEYILKIIVKPEGEEESSFEETLEIKSNKYAEEYDSYMAENRTLPYIDEMLLLDQKEKDGAEISDKDYEDYIESLRDSFDSDEELTDESCMIAAILYKETGDFGCRKVVEEYFTEIADSYLEGTEIDFSKRQSLYYGIVMYLKTERSVNYSLSETLMRMLIDNAIGLTNRDMQEELPRLFEMDRDKAILEANVNSHLLMLANSVGMSTDYVRSAALYLQYAGADKDSAFVLYEMSKSEKQMNQK